MSEHATHIVPYKSNVLIWIDLLILTFVTIEIAQFNFHDLTVVIALLVASMKTYLVGYFFMHLKFENIMFRIFVGIMAFVFISFMAILFFDYSFR
ncbi:MAG: cytochrome C oxidase subunit IV family protein [Bacteroidales bacterium]|jgi:cytochrome c oxidase subunit 4|nr:cytochrome C oxidase subunit IV family protein [Bacteroidales bacterium]